MPDWYMPPCIGFICDCIIGGCDMPIGYIMLPCGVASGPGIIGGIEPIIIGCPYIGACTPTRQRLAPHRLTRCTTIATTTATIGTLQLGEGVTWKGMGAG